MFGNASARYWLRLSSTAGITITSSTTLSKYTGFNSAVKSNNWPTVTDFDDILIPVTGLWLFGIHDLDWGDAGSGAGQRKVGRRINDVAGSIRLGANNAPTLAAANTPTVQSYTEARPLTAGDTIQWYWAQSSGSDKTAAIVSCFFILIEEMASNPLAVTDN